MQSDLWAKIQQFPIDSPQSTQPFSAKLASENNWDTSFTKQAIEEYKRFLYLCIVEKGVMTPSESVDKVWHLHLTYTRNYWDDLCRDTIGKPIHHTPSDGSDGDSSKYSEAYSETLRCYSQHFNCAPPTVIWGMPDLKNSTTSSSAQGGCVRAFIVIFIALFSFIAIGSGMAPFYVVLPLAALAAIIVIKCEVSNHSGGGAFNNNSHSNDASGCGSDSSCGSSCGGGGCGGGGD